MAGNGTDHPANHTEAKSSFWKKLLQQQAVVVVAMEEAPS